MARKHEFIKISNSEIAFITKMLNKGEHSSRCLARAQILLLNHRGKNTDEIVNSVNRSKSTVHNILRTYKQSGLEAAIYDKPRPGRPKTILGKDRAKITALACTDTPDGRIRWTLRLLADKAVELDYVEKGSISHTSIGEILKKTNLDLI